MTLLPENPEKGGHWHGTRGEHLFPHPAQYESRKSLWSAHERRYAAHLDRHHELAVNPEPMPDDHPAVVALFEHIASLEKTIEKEKLLITAIRRKAAQGREVDSLELLETQRVLREGGIG